MASNKVINCIMDKLIQSDEKTKTVHQNHKLHDRKGWTEKRGTNSRFLFQESGGLFRRIVYIEI